MRMSSFAVAIALVGCGSRASGPVPSARPADTSAVYEESQVDTPVKPLSRTMGPVYPSELRKAGVSGEVLARFVVDAEGRVEIPTIRILRSTHVEFSSSIRTFLGTVRFHPAVRQGQPVRVLVYQPFNFTLRQYRWPDGSPPRD